MKHLTGFLALAVALGCGTAQAQISDGVIKLGVLNDMSSLYADIGGKGSVLAAQMAADDVGNITGARIEIVSSDHQNKPDIGAGIARQWIDVEHVDAIVDVPTSSVALAVQEVTREKKHIFLMSGPASSDLTGKACSPYGFQWTYDTYALAHGTGGAIVKQGGDTWFFITTDYAFGHALERDTGDAVKAAGGKVLGAVRVPLNTQDFSSFLLQAQASKAKVIGLANAGGDTINSIKEAAEFGLVSGGQKLAGLLVFLTAPFARPEDRARPHHHIGLVLGQGRPGARLRQTVHGEEQGRSADLHAGRCLQRGLALPQGDQGHRHR
jgi:branched-chain amino acid transport system substrate-binding protein